MTLIVPIVSEKNSYKWAKFYIKLFVLEKYILLNTALRFDLLANGGASLTLSYERAPFPTLHRTVWLPWNVYHVMDTVVMKREENDIPSCYLTGLLRPNPLIVSTPLSTLYKTSPEDNPIIPETQVRPSVTSGHDMIHVNLYFKFSPSEWMASQHWELHCGKQNVKV